MRIPFWILILALPLMCGWTNADKNLYQERHFVELAHRLIMQNKIKEASLLRKQQEDLSGCRFLHEGKGGVDALISCVRFINREKQLGFNLKGSEKLAKDINIICGGVSNSAKDVTKIIESGVFESYESGRWRSCQSLVWRQVYLTAYANFDADPVGTLAYVRKAQTHVSGHFLWTDKTLALFQTKDRESPAWP